MPQCARCHAPAYHVEQVVGPAGKIYHKACLKCLNCGKRLDSHLLVEHDDEPYCKNCHLQMFGTRDLRHFNHPTMPSPSSATSPLKASSAAAAPPVTAQSYLQRPPVPPKPSFTSTSRALPPLLPARAERLVIEPVQERSAASLAVTGSSSRSGARFGVTGSPASTSKAGWRVEEDTEKCPGCNKTVYHAEQVVALDRKWHKSCLRCSNCSATLAAGKVLDHRGQVLCAKCHIERTGGGYAMR